MKTPPTFEDIAKDIIAKSVQSVMFVDDELREPFSSEGDETLSRGIYGSFRAQNSSLDFYKFRDEATWKSDLGYTLENRDMVVLDWELSKKSPEYQPTLQILSDAIKKPNLHFVCIYTATESRSFPEIIYKINCFFTSFTKEELSKNYNELTAIIEDHGLSFQEVFDENIQRKLSEMVLYRERAGSLFNEIKKQIETKFSIDLFKQIQQYYQNQIKIGVYQTLLHGFCALGMYLNQEITGADLSNDISKDIKNSIAHNYLILNHTIVVITNKTEVKPSNIFQQFSDAIIRDSGNFLTLMGLEMRYLFKQSSGFIGKDIDSINELAFFHHKERSIPPEAFFDFLRELWKSQTSSFLYDLNNQPRVFEVLDEYKKSKGIDEQLKVFTSDSKYQQHLGKLNYYYNILKTTRKVNDQIKFGDIFRIYSEDGEETNHYLLCITAHCDCLYSKEKIKNMFYFVAGSKGNLTDSLNKGDTGFDAYIINKKNIEVVNWGDKPFTLFIKNTSNNIDNDIAVMIGEEKKILKYHSTLKENYAQRIANHAFVYPLHVGIFFADTK
jgi:hypothetical protein